MIYHYSMANKLHLPHFHPFDHLYELCRINHPDQRIFLLEDEKYIQTFVQIMPNKILYFDIIPTLDEIK